MRIGELSKETGVSERSIRHYEEKGLLLLSASQMVTVILMKVPSKSGAYSNVLTNWLKFRRDGKDAALP